MGKYFGTDGVRGKANEYLTAELAYRIGLAASDVLAKNISRKPKILVGKDTRISGDMLEFAIVSGVCAAGGDVSVLRGAVPAPAVAFLVKECGYDAGMMISASHNQAFDNGIKIFNSLGLKISDALEEKIERAIDGYADIELKTGESIGTVKRDDLLIDAYIGHISQINDNRGGLRPRVAIDCANGAASLTAERIFGNANISFELMNDRPDGLNINRNCGSTHLEQLMESMKTGKYDIGFAFDGDADRCLAVDEAGNAIDGDRIICVLADAMKQECRLKNNSVAVTKLSNLGLHKFCDGRGIKVEQTDVGDRYVVERMLEKGISIGGEQSGHIIFSEYATTGDGQMTAVLILNILKKQMESGKKASEIFGIMKNYPQVSLNVKVGSDRKKEIMASRPVMEAAEKIKALLGGNGRVVLRPSGTEPLIRIMAEGESLDAITAYAKEIEGVILDELKKDMGD